MYEVNKRKKLFLLGWIRCLRNFLPKFLLSKVLIKNFDLTLKFLTNVNAFFKSFYYNFWRRFSTSGFFLLLNFFNFSDWLELFVMKKRVVSNSFFAIQIEKNIDSYENILRGKLPKQQKKINKKKKIKKLIYY